MRYGRTTNSYCVKCGWIDGYAKGYLYLRIRDIWKGRRPLTVLGVKRCIEEGECGKEIRRVLGCDKCRVVVDEVVLYDLTVFMLDTARTGTGISRLQMERVNCM